MGNIAKKINYFEIIKDYGTLIIGNILVAIAVVVFFEPNSLVTGGVSGIAIIISDITKRLYDFNLPLWITNTVLNIPLFIAAYKVLGGRFLGKTLFSTLFFSFSMYMAAYLPVYNQDLVMATLVGAVLSGVGAGLIFKCRATTGGTDLLASMMHKYFKHISIPKFLLAIDAFIIAAGFVAFGASATFYAIFAVYVVSKVTDTVLEGFDFATAALIISDQHEEIGKRIMEETERGATYLNAQGVYTQKEKKVILVVMNPKEIVILKDLVKETDPNAFLIVYDVREVLGEGFQRIA